MADYIDEIGQRCPPATRRIGRGAADGHKTAIDRTTQVCTQSGQIGGPEYIDTRHQRCFRRTTQGQIDLGHACVGVADGRAVERGSSAGVLPRRPARHGERAAHRAQRARQR